MIKKFFSKTIITLSTMLLPHLATAALDLTNQDEQLSYSLGFAAAEHLKSQIKLGLKINIDTFTQGVKDNLNNKSQLDPQQIIKVLTNIKERQAKTTNQETTTTTNVASNSSVNSTNATTQSSNMNNTSNNSSELTNNQPMNTATDLSKASNLGQGFLAQNKKEPGIVELNSGLQYKIINAGDQNAKSPTTNDKVKVHYRGTLIDGTEFDSSYKRNEPTSFEVNAVIKGWQEALMLMKPKATWKIFVPANLAYGAEGAPGTIIGPNAVLIFDLELLEVNPS